MSIVKKDPLISTGKDGRKCFWHSEAFACSKFYFIVFLVQTPGAEAALGIYFFLTWLTVAMVDCTL